MMEMLCSKKTRKLNRAAILKRNWWLLRGTTWYVIVIGLVINLHLWTITNNYVVNYFYNVFPSFHLLYQLIIRKGIWPVTNTGPAKVYLEAFLNHHLNHVSPVFKWLLNSCDLYMWLQEWNIKICCRLTFLSVLLFVMLVI